MTRVINLLKEKASSEKKSLIEDVHLKGDYAMLYPFDEEDLQYIVELEMAIKILEKHNGNG